MSLTKSWYTFDEAASKFGVSTKQLQIWVDNGVVRTEDGKSKITMLNGNDIELELHLVPSV
ncbi:MAG: MerR family transcriptional regulator [Desulfuromonadaceae bacterium]|nr:MerR family transcriptional regulator [Desulfuromonadaceae bacterium]